MDAHAEHDLDRQIRAAVRGFCRTRGAQSRATTAGDRGARRAVTGGRQLDGFVEMLSRLATNAGVSASHIYHRSAVELPGYFRPTKKWDFLIVQDGRLLVAIEMKSQVGPSFGNNFNNRVEEAVGSAVDLWTAHREGALGSPTAPWVGYLILVEDCQASTRAVALEEPHFPVLGPFRSSSYCRRYGELCRRLQLERLYTSTALLTSPISSARTGNYAQPEPDLCVELFVRSFLSHLQAHYR